MPESADPKPTCCCCSCSDRGGQTAQAVAAGSSSRLPPWVTGSVTTPAGDVPVITTRLRAADHIGAWKARWAIGRMNYRVEPGLYAVGNPTSESHVFVSANYKMSFDRLRSALAGVDGWVLVLDTKGVNVWCAAGKGTFGTDELIRQVEAGNLSNVVAHRRLVVPQLGAPGIAAHEVQKRCGFRVFYGPVRAGDIRAFLEAGMKATAQMRRVRFPLRDRLAVIPVELVMSARYVLATMATLLILAGLTPGGYSWARVAGEGIVSAALFGGAFLAATVLSPALLPWLPGRALSLKGTWIGIAFLAATAGFLWANEIAPTSWVSAAAWCLIIPVTASFAAMGYTGTTTYTSLSGVRREMRIAVPIQATAAILGGVLWIAGRFV